MEKFLPMDVELDEIRLNKDLVRSLDKLTLFEETMAKDFKNLSKGFKNSNEEITRYLEIQNQVIRHYIQLINRNSDLVAKVDLNNLKNHVKKMEERLENQLKIETTLKDLSMGYKEYAKSLGDYTKATHGLLKKQGAWHDNASTHAKLKHNPRVTGEKLEKIEAKLATSKEVVRKRYEERKHRNGFVQHGMQRISELWLKLKMQITKIEW